MEISVSLFSRCPKKARNISGAVKNADDLNGIAFPVNDEVPAHRVKANRLRG